MKAIERFEKYKNEDFDKVILHIKNGILKAGKYSHLIKIDNDKKMKGKVFFDDGKSDSNERK